jgi:hypothetical protein
LVGCRERPKLYSTVGDIENPKLSSVGRTWGGAPTLSSAVTKMRENADDKENIPIKKQGRKDAKRQKT